MDKATIESGSTFKFVYDSDEDRLDFARAARHEAAHDFVSYDAVEGIEDGRSVFCGNEGRNLARLAQVCLGVTVVVES